MEKIDFNEILSLKPSVNKHDFDFNDPIILYGAGAGGEYFLKLLKEDYGIEPAAICDTYKAGQEFFGYKLYTAEEIKEKFNNAKIAITSLNYYFEIKKYLLSLFSEQSIINISIYKDAVMDKGFIKKNKNEINEVFNMLADEKSKETYVNIIKGRLTADNYWGESSFVDSQYFCNDLISLSDSESFVDAGAYVGDTLDFFIKLTNNKFKNIYCFEPGSDNFKRLMLTKEKYNKDERIKLFKAGLFEYNGKIGFEDDSVSSRNSINLDSSNSIEVVALDKVINDEVTFIKMDIEGAELEALKGATNLIKTQKPKLAICIYHKNEHFIEIPKFIKSLRDDYKLYIRHHSNSSFLETVLYAL